ncbi:hypothetical protein Dda_6186 [Drechslerella dactyloides]|uniref:Replication protein A C-terminal domain-containing protein n=1 Tax=Drechslerella dactyloides TaxID=74499 RepID=A0AAD6IZK5_DREDA|nr:hypothetical protein Dda_6186 [Drechslerella dactyloides]
MGGDVGLEISRCWTSSSSAPENLTVSAKLSRGTRMQDVLPGLGVAGPILIDKELHAPVGWRFPKRNSVIALSHDTWILYATPLDIEIDERQGHRRAFMMASQHTLSKLVPPLNFACVEEGLFRSAGPLALNLPFISELALNTVIWMAKEDPSPEFLQLAEEKGIKVLNFGIPEITTAWEPEVERNISGALQAIADASNGRILVSCTMGRHRTGTVIGCFRRLQNWSTASGDANTPRPPAQSTLLLQIAISELRHTSEAGFSRLIYLETITMSYGNYDGGYQTGNYGGGGGFMSGSQGGSQASPGKSAAKNTLRPVTIKQVLEAQNPHDDTTFAIDGHDIGNITFIAQIRNIADQETSTTFKMEDGTGTIEVKKFRDNKHMSTDLDDESASSHLDPGLTVNAYARIVGNIRQFNNKRNIATSSVRPVSDFNEIQCHFLEATAVHLYFTRGPPEIQQGKGDAGAYQQGAGTYAQDTEMGGAANTAGSAATMLPPGISANARKIYGLLKNRQDSSEGMHISMIGQQAKIPLAETYKAVDELLTNGVCYTTMDDEHIACMDF